MSRKSPLVLRTPADALRDPRPGDVVKMGNITRTVKSVGTCVLGIPRIVYERRKVSLISAQTKRWQKWATNATVVHVAQEGGEG